MPLPAAIPREEVHLRRVECRGYQRADGLWDIEAHLVDTKAHGFESKWRGRIEPNEPIHGMWVRVTIDDDFVVHDAVAVTDHSPFSMCPEAAGPMTALKGLRIGAGWNAEVRRRLGGAKGCTHLVELLGPLATTAYQSLVHVRLSKPDVVDETGRPVKIDSCYAYASQRDLVRDRWPEFYTGPSMSPTRDEN